MMSSTSSSSAVSSFATMTFNDTTGRTTNAGTQLQPQQQQQQQLQQQQQQKLGVLGINSSANVTSTLMDIQQQQPAIIQQPPPPPPLPSLPPVGAHQPVSINKQSQFFRVDNDEVMEPPPVKTQIDTRGPLAAATTSTSGIRPLSHDVVNRGQQSFQNINKNNVTSEAVSTQQWHSRDDTFKTGRGGTFTTGLDSQDSRKRKSFDDKRQSGVSADFGSSGSFYAEKRSQASSFSSSGSHGNGGSNSRNTDSYRYSSSGKDEYNVDVGDARMLVDGNYHNRHYTTSHFQSQMQQNDDRRWYGGKQEQQPSRYSNDEGRGRESYHYHVDNDRQYDSYRQQPQYLQHGKRRYDDAGYNR